MFKGWKIWVLSAIACLFVIVTACQSPRPVAQPSSPSPSPESSPVASPSISPALPPPVSEPPPIVSRERLMTDLKALNFERYTAAELQKTRAYIAQTLTSAGWTVSEQPFDTGVNVVAERPGIDPNAGVVLVGAHYDSVRGSPGADDNATGVVAALEVARLLGDLKTLRPLRIVLFDQEEAGLVGSYAYAQRPDNLKNLEGVVILEMLGYSCSTPGCQQKPGEFKVELPSDRGDFLAIAGDAEHLPLLNAFSDNHKPNLPPLVSVSVPFKGLLTPVVLRSDHTPFWFEGIGAVMVTDTAHLRNPHYHRRTDTPDTVDPTFLQGNTQTVVNAVTSLLDRPKSFRTVNDQES
ncbi:M28 family peptidase [Acaryochloris sp. IP29b_bin.137]|uniref:M28 family peptidase n=1 Tax=Acaryochloris sp. IP29b_bin.137 TaxID=2969217 RepID=UPI00260C3BC9|nr:M28 family peptidase [Acaryochloris sp. IP29b_bin.137]